MLFMKDSIFDYFFLSRKSTDEQKSCKINQHTKSLLTNLTYDQRIGIWDRCNRGIFNIFKHSETFCFDFCNHVKCTVKSVLSGHLKIDETKVLKTNGSLVKVESIAECSLGAFCNTFDLH